jgi:transposase InsO family protein
MPKGKNPRGAKKARQRWRTFLANHLPDIAAIDFFTVPTAAFRVLYVFVVLDLGRRRILHFNATEHPTAEWTAQQIVEAFPGSVGKRFLLRDRDGIYGKYFRKRTKGLGLREILCSPHAPWQNAYAERLIGSIRRECVDHVIVLNERHLMRLMGEYVAYHNGLRTHLSLNKDPPLPRPVHAPRRGRRIVEFPHLGGLHHHYERRAA